MKNQKPNRNKLPLILASLLTLALIAYGSFAYFTQSAEEEIGMSLTLGHIDLSFEGEEWTYKPTGEVNEQLINTNNTTNKIAKEVTLGKEASLENARPGDRFERNFTFNLNTSLDTKLTMSHDFSMMKQIDGEDHFSQVVGPFEIDLIPIENSFDSTSINGLVQEEEGYSLYMTPNKSTVKFKVAVEVLDTIKKEIDTNEFNEIYNKTTEKVNLNDVIGEWANTINIKAEQTNIPK